MRRFCHAPRRRGIQYSENMMAADESGYWITRFLFSPGR